MIDSFHEKKRPGAAQAAPTWIHEKGGLMDDLSLHANTTHKKSRIYGPNYRLARSKAFARSGGLCQACGLAQATEAHHWRYVCDEEVTSDDLTAVCGVCHLMLTTLRRQILRGANRFELQHKIEEAIAECSTESQSVGLVQSSITTGQPGLTTRSPVSREIAAIAAKRGGNRTEADEDRLRELECQRALWIDEGGAPTIPATAIRATIEGGARKRKQGPQVRGGLVVLNTCFEYDMDRYGETIDELGKQAQFVVPVVVQRNRILRTRAKFDPPWSCTFEVDVDEELVDKSQLLEWLGIAGRQIGLGDWRPEKSGTFGRFNVSSIEEGSA